VELAETDFVGREREISRLSEWLNSPERKPMMVSGLGGIGKTTLVSEFVRRNYKPRQVAWVGLYDKPTSVGATDKLVNDIVALAAMPEIVILDDIDQLPKDELVSLMARIKKILPQVPIIVTSRQPIDSDSAVLNLSPLQPAESVELLVRLGFDRQDQDLSTLAVELGNFPLALKIAAPLGKTMPTD
jgi:DNA polymerase III delta prime subunit